MLAGITTVVAGGLTTTAVAGESLADAATITACAAKKSGVLRLAKACKRSERKVSWSTTGPGGPAGPAGPGGPVGPAGPRGESGPPGAPATTPIAVEYTSTSANSHDVAAIGGMTVRLECGSGRIGESAVDFYVTRADEVHGMVTNTQYDGNTVESATSAAFDSGSAPSGAPASAFVSGTGTHATQQAQLTLLKDGAVYTLTLYTSRDIRQGRPVCEFIGAMTQQGAPTVTPS